MARKKIFEEPIEDESQILIQCPHCEYIAEDTKHLVAHWREYPCEQYCTVPFPRQFRHTSYGEPLLTFPPSKEQLSHRVKAVAVVDSGSHVALELRRGDDQVVFIPQDGAGLGVETLPCEQFDKTYTPIMDYPTGRCAQLLLNFARFYGASAEALHELGKLIRVTGYDSKKAADRLKSNKGTKIAEPVETAKGVRTKTKKRRKDSAATMFRNLIMEGGRTDDEILAEVQKVYPNVQRSYVSQYRSLLKKEGRRPPRAIRSDAKKRRATPVAKKPVAKKPVAKKPVAKKPVAKKTKKKRVFNIGL